MTGFMKRPGLDSYAEDWLDKNKAKQRKYVLLARNYRALLHKCSMALKALRPFLRYKTGDFPDPYPLPTAEATIGSLHVDMLQFCGRRNSGPKWTCQLPRFS